MVRGETGRTPWRTLVLCLVFAATLTLGHAFAACTADVDHRPVQQLEAKRLAGSATSAAPAFRADSTAKCDGNGTEQTHCCHGASAWFADGRKVRGVAVGALLLAAVAFGAGGRPLPARPPTRPLSDPARPTGAGLLALTCVSRT